MTMLVPCHAATLLAQPTGAPLTLNPVARTGDPQPAGAGADARVLVRLPRHPIQLLLRNSGRAVWHAHLRHHHWRHLPGHGNHKASFLRTCLRVHESIHSFTLWRQRCSIWDDLNC